MTRKLTDRDKKIYDYWSKVLGFSIPLENGEIFESMNVYNSDLLKYTKKEIIESITLHVEYNLAIYFNTKNFEEHMDKLFDASHASIQLLDQFQKSVKKTVKANPIDREELKEISGMKDSEKKSKLVRKFAKEIIKNADDFKKHAGDPLISYANAEKELKRQRKIYEEMKRALAKKDKEILEREENNFLTKTTNFIMDLLIDHFKKIILIIIAIIILLLILDKFSLLPWTTL